MNLNPIHTPGWPDEPTLPIPLLRHIPEFAPTQAEVHEVQPIPAEACTELGAEPPRVVDTLRRQRAITAVLFITLAAVICGVSLVGYLKVPTP